MMCKGAIEYIFNQTDKPCKKKKTKLSIIEELNA